MSDRKQGIFAYFQYLIFGNSEDKHWQYMDSEVGDFPYITFRTGALTLNPPFTPDELLESLKLYLQEDMFLELPDYLEPYSADNIGYQKGQSYYPLDGVPYDIVRNSEEGKENEFFLIILDEEVFEDIEAAIASESNISDRAIEYRQIRSKTEEMYEGLEQDEDDDFPGEGWKKGQSDDREWEAEVISDDYYEDDVDLVIEGGIGEDSPEFREIIGQEHAAEICIVCTTSSLMQGGEGEEDFINILMPVYNTGIQGPFSSAVSSIIHRDFFENQDPEGVEVYLMETDSKISIVDIVIKGEENMGKFQQKMDIIAGRVMEEIAGSRESTELAAKMLVNTKLSELKNDGEKKDKFIDAIITGLHNAAMHNTRDIKRLMETAVQCDNYELAGILKDRHEFMQKKDFVDACLGFKDNGKENGYQAMMAVHLKKLGLLGFGISPDKSQKAIEYLDSLLDALTDDSGEVSRKKLHDAASKLKHGIEQQAKITNQHINPDRGHGPGSPR